MPRANAAAPANCSAGFCKCNQSAITVSSPPKVPTDEVTVRAEQLYWHTVSRTAALGAKHVLALSRWHNGWASLTNTSYDST